MQSKGKFIPHSQTTLDDREERAVLDVIRSGVVSQSKRTEEFEQKFASYIGKKYGVATVNGTSGLHIALLSLGIGNGDEVILHSYSCASPLLAIKYTKAKPILVDIEPENFNIDLYQVKKKITNKTKAVIVYHMFGCPAEVSLIKDICRKNGIYFIEDCNHSLGAIFEGKRLGSYGDIGCFNFYATKMITTCEGGMVVTDDKEITQKIRDLRSFSVRTFDALKSGGKMRFESEDNKIRFNYKMNDVQAAIGIAQLQKLNDFIKKRREIANIYNESFKNYKEVLRTPIEPNGKLHVYYRYVITLMNRKAEEFVGEMWKRGIGCGMPNVPSLNRSILTGMQITMPNTDMATKSNVSIPIYPNLKNENISRIINAVKEILL